MAGTYGTTYAIHGTNNNQAIGKWTTLGCIRMYNNDIHWLFARSAASYCHCKIA